MKTSDILCFVKIINLIFELFSYNAVYPKANNPYINL